MPCILRSGSSIIDDCSLANNQTCRNRLRYAARPARSSPAWQRPTPLSTIATQCRRHPYCTVLIAALCGGVAVAAASIVWQRQRFQEHYRGAMEALSENDFVRARAQAALCLQARPNSVPARILSSRIERLAGDYDEAEHRLDECRQMGAAGEAADLEALLLRTQAGDLTDSQTLAARVDANDPESVAILEALAHGYRKAYRFRDALRCLGRLIEMQPDHARALTLRGQILQGLGHDSAAADDFRRAVEARPTVDEFRVCLGEVLLNMNRPDEAAIQFETLAQHLGTNPAVQLGLARCLRAQGRRLQESLATLRRLTSLYPEEGPMWLDRGQLEMDTENLEAAEASLRQAVRLAPNDQASNYRLLQCLRRRGRQKEAATVQAHLAVIEQDLDRLNALRRKLLEQPFAPEKRCEVGQLCLRVSKEEEARGWLESALWQDPRCRAAYEGLALYCERVGNNVAATRYRQLAASLPREGGGEPVTSNKESRKAD
jgi:tetratricopeptide (TPR) repeat protein